MYNTAKKQVWFGELRTSKGSTVVVHDNQLPEAPKGRIYLYNTARNVIGEYVEDIVKVNLHDLDADGLKAAEAEFGDAFRAARAEFMAKNQTRIDLSKVPDTAPVRKAKPVPEADDLPDLDDTDDDDVFGDDDEDYNDDDSSE
ncbi:hypothetical protein [Shewanella sp. SR44-3]|uniref:hypothetical protein n=1 Tax=unclassified Shewanella TaxID=196818 RepID=UPI0015FDBD23|nr:hypothetical protein [Shewanella sp. SR44-3]MBB1270803.1 hypothetical protein [Shewanella sp. SR44-3]